MNFIFFNLFRKDNTLHLLIEKRNKIDFSSMYSLQGVLV